MFKITIEGETLEELASNVLHMAGQFQTTGVAPVAKLKAHKPAKPSIAPAVDDGPIPEETDAELEAELNAPVEPMPETAKAIVDAGTGKPAAPAKEPVVQMTFDDVKKSTAKLVAKNMPKAAELLKKYGAAKISDVPKDKLGDFAADVMEALG